MNQSFRHLMHCTLVLGLGACSSSFVPPSSAQEKTPLLDICVGRNDDACQQRLAFAERVIGSTVSITSSSYNQSEGAGTFGGTGFVIEGGYIATAYHVVDDAPFIYVKFRRLSRSGYVMTSARGYPVFIVNYDKSRDIALLKPIEKSIPLPPPLRVRTEQGLTVGEPVWQFGKRSMWTWGEIVGLNVPFAGKTGNIHASTAVQHGDSGGPIVDTSGRVIGVTILMNAKTKYGYFMPMDHVLKLVPPTP